METRRVEWWSKHCHFIKHHTHRPHICAKCVRLRLYDFRREVVWRTYAGTGFLNSVREHLGDAQISYLDETARCHEDVLSLQIPVDDFPVMNVLHTQTDLSKPVQNLILRKWSTALVLYPFLQITTQQEIFYKQLKAHTYHHSSP